MTDEEPEARVFVPFDPGELINPLAIGERMWNEPGRLSPAALKICADKVGVIMFAKDPPPLERAISRVLQKEFPRPQRKGSHAKQAYRAAVKEAFGQRDRKDALDAQAQGLEPAAPLVPQEPPERGQLSLQLV